MTPDPSQLSPIFAVQTGDATMAMRLPYHLLKGFLADGGHPEVWVVAGQHNEGVTNLWGQVPVTRVGRSRRSGILRLGWRLFFRRRDMPVLSFVWDRHGVVLALARVLFGKPYAVFLDTFEYQASSDRAARGKDARRYGLMLRHANVILAETPTALAQSQRKFPQAMVLPAPPCSWRQEMLAVENQWNAESYAPVRRPVILFAGRIVPRKNVHDLLTAFSRLRARFPDWSVEVRGIVEDPAYQETLKEQIAQLGLQECVAFLPPVYGEALYKQYRETEIFCLPSQGEGMPSAIAEAMYFSQAIVASDAGCMAYQLDYGTCGLLHAPGDVDQLTACLETLMASPETRRALHAKARARVTTVFAWETYYPAIKAAFLDMSAKK